MKSPLMLLYRECISRKHPARLAHIHQKINVLMPSIKRKHFARLVGKKKLKSVQKYIIYGKNSCIMRMITPFKALLPWFCWELGLSRN